MRRDCLVHLVNLTRQGFQQTLDCSLGPLKHIDAIVAQEVQICVLNHCIEMRNKHTTWIYMCSRCQDGGPVPLYILQQMLNMALDIAEMCSLRKSEAVHECQENVLVSTSAFSIL